METKITILRNKISNARDSVVASRTAADSKAKAYEKVAAMRRQLQFAPVQRQIAVLCAVQRKACSAEGLRQCKEQVVRMRSQAQLKTQLTSLSKQREGLVVRLKLAVRVLVEPEIALADGTVQTLSLLGIALPAAAVDVDCISNPEVRQRQIAAMQELLRPVVKHMKTLNAKVGSAALDYEADYGIMFEFKSRSIERVLEEEKGLENVLENEGSVVQLVLRSSVLSPRSQAGAGAGPSARWTNEVGSPPPSTTSSELPPGR